MINVSEAVKIDDLEAIQQELAELVQGYRQNAEVTTIEVEKVKFQTQPDETVEEIVEEESVTPEQAKAKVYEFRKKTRGRTEKRVESKTVDEQFSDAEVFKQARKQAHESKKMAWVDREIPPKAGHLNFNGREFKYKLVRNTVDWGESLSSSKSDLLDNLDYIRCRITMDIRNQFGDWSRISVIVISGGQLIVNGIMYVPMIEPQYISRLPLDVEDYIQGGCIAPLFDFGSLKKMSGLHTFVCDDADFYVTNIGADLGMGKRIGVSTIFGVCLNLNSFTLAGDTVTRDGLNKPESVEIKKKVRERKRFLNLMDGYKIDVYAGTNGLQSYMFSNLKNYATNRGDKGIVRFCGGVLTRGALAGTAGLLNLGAHIVGGLAKTVKTAIHEAVTPVDSEDVY